METKQGTSQNSIILYTCLKLGFQIKYFFGCINYNSYDVVLSTICMINKAIAGSTYYSIPYLNRRLLGQSSYI